jgi:hypothetical protein
MESEGDLVGCIWRHGSWIGYLGCLGDEWIVDGS